MLTLVLRKPFCRLVDWARSRNGNVAVMFALVLPVVAGAAGLGVETSYWYYRGLQLQTAADASAFAAGMEKRSGATENEIEAMALLTAEDNGFDPDIGTVTVHSPPTSGAYVGSDAVEVILTGRAERFFTLVFNNSDVNLRARSVATFAKASDACVLALHPTAGAAAKFSGNTHVTLDGCSVMANSVASNAIQTQGSVDVRADCMIAVGGTDATVGVTLTECPAPITQAPPVGDPFSDVPVPAMGSTQNDNGAVLNPGRYPSGMDLKNTKTLNPGVYYVQGDLNINANANITGAGVTFYVTNGGHVTINGNATLNLTAPTTGTYAGVLFFGDRSITTGTNKFNGTAGSKMTGAIYFPGQNIEYAGNFSGDNGCTHVVGRTVEWTGSTTIAVDCTAYGMRKIPAYTLVKVSE